MLRREAFENPAKGVPVTRQAVQSLVQHPVDRQADGRQRPCRGRGTRREDLGDTR
ncbi:hypothetical protein [Streptomyces zhihengii]|uniref:hypothetical protein n=1 Tax=Streptomyces zhihengii TaxID=1818004 RepID=UPI0033BD63F2